MFPNLEDFSISFISLFFILDKSGLKTKKSCGHARCEAGSIAVINATAPMMRTEYRWGDGVSRQMSASRLRSDGGARPSARMEKKAALRASLCNKPLFDQSKSCYKKMNQSNNLTNRTN